MEKILIKKEVKIPGTNVILEAGDNVMIKKRLITKSYADQMVKRFSKLLDFLKDK